MPALIYTRLKRISSHRKAVRGGMEENITRSETKLKEVAHWTIGGMCKAVSYKPSGEGGV